MTTTRAFVISLMLLIIALSPEVLAQKFDMPLPARSTAACEGPLCALINPAGLSFADDGAFLFVHAEGWSVGGRPASRADALLATAYGMGFALQFVQPDVETAEGSADYLKLDLVLPLFKHRRVLSVAAGLSILDPTETDETPSVDVKLSAMLRISRHLSLGLVGRQLAAAGIHGVSAHRSLDMGLAIRPLWFAPERLTLALDATLMEGGNDPPLRFTALARPFNGLALVASANLDGAFGLGLSIDFLRAQVGGFTWFDDQADNQGMILTAGASLAMGPGMVLREQRSAEILLDAHWSPAIRPTTSWLGKKNNLLETVLAIRRAGEDDRVDSLIIRIEDANLPFHAAQELRQAIAAFRLTGKKVAFYLESATGNSYYLACAGDAIYLNPAGAFHVTGRSFQATFLRGALDLIGVRAEAHRVGDYKSAVESLTQDRPSPAYLEVLNSLADETSQELFSAIAQGRGITLERVTDLIDSGVFLPRQALEADLIDGVAHEDEVDLLVADAFGHPAHRIRDYAKQRRIDLSWSNHPTIAIVHATGSIARQPGLTGGMRVRDLVETLQNLQRDSSVAAVVLRVDSPGGSILASELIRREVDTLTQFKPVVVSMASVAASGGYYISLLLRGLDCGQPLYHHRLHRRLQPAL
ncbi:MAG: S49 family peptidase [Deltaproteobacteria bacterium]|nr:S49 family peptidase [Deltaproteobacteria bacterium]